MEPFTYHEGQRAIQREANSVRCADKLSSWVGPVTIRVDGQYQSGYSGGAKLHKVSTDLEVFRTGLGNDHFLGSNGSESFFGNGGSDYAEGGGGNDVLVGGDLKLDRLARTVQRAGVAIELQPREFNILDLLAQHVDQIVTRTMLYERIWDYHFEPKSSVVETHLSRLRAKIDKPFDVELIKTVRGVGYILASPK